MEHVFLTKEGYEQLRQELSHLKVVKRKDIAGRILEAREQGDLKENSGYDAAKEAQAFNEKRISELEGKLSRVTIIDLAHISKETVSIGAKITVTDIACGEIEELTMVSAVEANYALGKISITSPVGAGLMDHKIGDIVEIKIPSGVIKYKIVKIE